MNGTLEYLRKRRCSRFLHWNGALSLLLSALLCGQSAGWAQDTIRLPEPVTGRTSSAAQSNRGREAAAGLLGANADVKLLKIVALEGHRAVNHIPTRATSIPVIEVRNENDLPVEGVEVTFELPRQGPGGTFAGRDFVLITKTNERGQAMAHGFQANHLPGEFFIRATATFQKVKAMFPIQQINSMKLISKRGEAGSRTSHKWVWVLVAGGMGAGAGIAAWRVTRPGPMYTVSVGSAMIGQPR